MQPFELKELIKLINTKDVQKCKDYINHYFFCSGVDIFFYDAIGGEFCLYKLCEARKKIPKDIPKVSWRDDDDRKHTWDASKYLGSVDHQAKLYRPTCHLGKPLVFEAPKLVQGETMIVNYINSVKQSPLDREMQIPQEAQEKASRGLQYILGFIKDIICGGYAQQDEYILNWLSCTAAGVKVQTHLLMEGDGGEGKSLLCELMREILGARYYSTSNVEEVCQYTSNFEGRSLIVLEEMPVSSNSSKRGFTDALKSLTTESVFACRRMHNQAYQQSNTFNIIVNSNHSAEELTQTNKRRAVAFDISRKRVGDVEYYNRLHKYICDKDVQLAFYLFLMSRFDGMPKDWTGNEVPMSIKRREKLTRSLPPSIKFLIEHYVLPKRDIDNLPRKQLREEFKTFFKGHYDQAQFGRDMAKCGVTKGTKLEGGVRCQTYRAEWQTIDSTLKDLGIISNFDEEYEEHEETEVQRYKRFLDERDRRIQELEQEIAKLKQQKKRVAKPKPLPEPEMELEVAEIDSSVEESYDPEDFDEVLPDPEPKPKSKPKKIQVQIKGKPAKAFTSPEERCLGRSQQWLERHDTDIVLKCDVADLFD
ncbi:uncharacterized protein MONBRDRAFT_6499 [Monosiga brevicollis MX1]|uniref:NrS-1 polymerase-like helicase domain-containing protein n=1 Tax=Monosiga brevicollis TaxID=81824 RepID=A9UU25_MONBE|nr:uncharacterized protein MONBRDRAFT_6499 [Monosiga brevicollis MX1]EDQ91349.1 predicted protein [Monosiga brevicollis MX1]|eukprot:XP_001743771.1 hypothetical protein [Monosiga brevicollis MX1]